MFVETANDLIYYLGYPVYYVAAAACIVEFLILETVSKNNIRLITSDLILIGLDIGTKLILGYKIFNDHWFDGYAIFNFQTGYISLAAAIILYDLFFYAEHYLMHWSNLFWSFHYVHHSSSRFGLSVGFRLSWLRPLRRLAFFIPMVLVGFPALIVILAMSIVNLWGFLVHSGSKIKFPSYLGFLMSPHLHSIHHEKRERSVNIGGMFTIWDRLFKTYEEKAADNPVYGVEGYQITLNPFKNQFFQFYKNYLKPK